MTNLTRVYCGIEGQLGDIIAYTAVLPWIKQKIPNSYLVFGISKRSKAIKVILERDPLIGEVFVHDIPDTGRYDWEELQMRKSCDFVFENKVNHINNHWPDYRDASQEWAFLQGMNVPKGLKPRLYARDRHKCPNTYYLDCPCPVRSWNKENWKQLDLYDLNSKTKEGYIWTFDEIVDKIKNARLLVTTNSVGMWIASAFDTPSILLLEKYYVPRVPAPPNNNQIIIERFTMEKVKVSTVKRAIKELEGTPQ